MATVTASWDVAGSELAPPGLEDSAGGPKLKLDLATVAANLDVVGSEVAPKEKTDPVPLDALFLADDNEKLANGFDELWPLEGAC